MEEMKRGQAQLDKSLSEEEVLENGRELQHSVYKVVGEARWSETLKTGVLRLLRVNEVMARH